MRKSERRRKQISTHVASDGRFFFGGDIIGCKCCFVERLAFLEKGRQ